MTAPGDETDPNGVAAAEVDAAAPPGPLSAEEYQTLVEELERSVSGDLDLDDEARARIKAAVARMHYADVADLFERLDSEGRRQLLDIIRDDFHPDILSEMDETVRDQIIEALGVDDLVAVLQELDTDDAVGVVEDLDHEDRQEVLDAIPAPDRTLIEQGLAYPSESAGRLMQREMVAVPAFWTVGETIDYMRDSTDMLPEAFYDIFVVDPRHRPVGIIPLALLMRTKRPVPVNEIMHTEMRMIPAGMDREDVAFLFRQRDLVSAPVVDDGGRLVGMVTIDDVVDVIDAEHEEDIMRLGGVTEDDLHETVFDTTRARFTWLLVNLGTAVLASVVIGLFDATLEQIVALAVLMPIVASMGGNAGTQSLTVAVRALAMKQVTATNALRVVGKEVVVGLINGTLFAILAAAVTWVWFDSPGIAVIIAVAMVVNLVVAGFAGALIPLGLERVGVDPAVASSVFLTTVTDVVGFFAFLGLAAVFLL